MAEAAYSARASTRSQVLESISELDLNKTENGQYTHDDAANFITGLKTILETTYNLKDAINGMSQLLIEDSTISLIKSTDAETFQSVLKKSKDDAKKESTTDNPVSPLFDDRGDAQEEANRLNLLSQAVIGAKEGTAQAITKIAGKDITDSILRTIDGTQQKSIDAYQLHELIAAVVQGANRPATADVLEMFTAVIAHQFNFQKKISYNVELLKSKAARLAAYGVTVDDTHLALITLANVEVATHEEYGTEFRIAMQAVRRKYPFNHKHDATSFEEVLKELASADGVRKLKDAPEPSLQQANAVNNQISYLTKLMQETATAPAEDDSSHYTEDYGYESANAATSNSESSRESRRPRERRTPRKADRKSSRRDRGGRDRSRARDPSRERPKVKDNPCKWCRKYKRPYPHEVKEKECFWNPAFKGYRKKWVCDEMEIRYVPQHKFDDDDE